MVCYFTNWAWHRAEAQYAPENIDPSLCTHVMYQYAVLDPNSLTLESFDERTDFENSESFELCPPRDLCWCPLKSLL